MPFLFKGGRIAKKVSNYIAIEQGLDLFFVFFLQKMYSCLHTTRVRIAFPARGNPSRQHKSTGKPEILLSAASSKKIKVQKGTIQPQTQ
jgi:hypothetical protein